jgi:hypothetical protein
MKPNEAKAFGLMFVVCVAISTCPIKLSAQSSHGPVTFPPAQLGPTQPIPPISPEPFTPSDIVSLSILRNAAETAHRLVESITTPELRKAQELESEKTQAYRAAVNKMKEQRHWLTGDPDDNWECKVQVGNRRVLEPCPTNTPVPTK